MKLNITTFSKKQNTVHIKKDFFTSTVVRV